MESEQALIDHKYIFLIIIYHFENILDLLNSSQKSNTGADLLHTIDAPGNEVTIMGEPISIERMLNI